MNSYSTSDSDHSPAVCLFNSVHHALNCSVPPHSRPHNLILGPIISFLIPLQVVVEVVVAPQPNQSLQLQEEYRAGLSLSLSSELSWAWLSLLLSSCWSLNGELSLLIIPPVHLFVGREMCVTSKKQHGSVLELRSGFVGSSC